MSSFLTKPEKTAWPDPEAFHEAPFDPSPPPYLKAHKAQIGRIPQDDTITMGKEKALIPARKRVLTGILCVSVLAVLIIIMAVGGVMRTEGRKAPEST